MKLKTDLIVDVAVVLQRGDQCRRGRIWMEKPYMHNPSELEWICRAGVDGLLREPLEPFPAANALQALCFSTQQLVDWIAELNRKGWEVFTEQDFNGEVIRDQLDMNAYFGSPID